MSRSQVHLSLPRHVDEVLEQIACRSNLSKSEVARQAILIADMILNQDSLTPEGVVTYAKIMLGVTTNG